jgi:DNA-directed RNA polymerase subunit RPC12/RpoP
VQTVEAPVLPCLGCGSPLAVDPTAAQARCPGCGATTAVPEVLRQRATDYRRSLETERKRIADARAPVQFEKIGLYFGIPMGIVIGGHIVATMFLDAEYADVEQYAFIGGLVLVGIAFFVWIAVTIARGARAEKPPPPVVVEAFVGSVPSPCSTCGGQVQFVVEQPNARCPYCGAAVYPTQAVQTALLGIAAERADLEVARRARAIARDLALSFDGGAVATAMSYVRWISFMTGPAILVGLGVTFLVQGGIPDVTRLGEADGLSLVGAALATIGGLALAVVVLVFVLVRVFSRASVMRRTVAQVGAAHGGRVGAGVRPLLDWLDAHWAADLTGDVFSVEASGGGTRITRASAALTFAGRPAFLVAAHAPHYKRVDLFFSQHRRRPVGAGQMTPAAQEIRSAGYGVVVSNGGVQLTHLDSDPRAYGPQTVAWLLERAAHVAAG